MRIEFFDENRLLTTENREQIEQNLLFALSRFSNEIVSVRVIARAISPSADGGWKCCAAVTLRGLGTVEVTDEAAGFQPGMANLIGRLGRTVARRLKPRRSITNASTSRQATS